MPALRMAWNCSAAKTLPNSVLQNNPVPWKVFCSILEAVSPCLAHASIPAQRQAARPSLKWQLSQYEEWLKLCSMCNPTLRCRENHRVLGPSEVKSDTEISASAGEKGIWYCSLFYFIFCFILFRFVFFCFILC